MKKTVLRMLTACFGAIIVLSFLSCNAALGPVPNVMGNDHTAARETLEDAGYKVVEIEADAENILSRTEWNRTVKKGEVFKVNDVACPDYSNEKNSPSVQNGKIRIYFAKEDYNCKK